MFSRRRNARSTRWRRLAKKLAISERNLRDMLDHGGELPWYRIGVQRRIDPVDVRFWLEGSRQGVEG